MRTALLFSLFMFSAMFQPAALSPIRQECTSCSSDERALKDMQSLKIGMPQNCFSILNPRDAEKNTRTTTNLNCC